MGGSHKRKVVIPAVGVGRVVTEGGIIPEAGGAGVNVPTVGEITAPGVESCAGCPFTVGETCGVARPNQTGIWLQPPKNRSINPKLANHTLLPPKRVWLWQERAFRTKRRNFIAKIGLRISRMGNLGAERLSQIRRSAQQLEQQMYCVLHIVVINHLRG